MRFHAKYVLVEDQVLEDVVFDVLEGRFTAIEHGHEAEVDLGNVLVVPGLVNAHSHAFQRQIRGATEHVLADRLDDNFWTWRAQMYGAALSMTPDHVYDASRLAFDEMVASGITCVGEFHYVHHDPKGDPYSDPNELAHQVIRAARDAGLRVRLLRVVYQRAGFGRPGEADQRRFLEPHIDQSMARILALADAYQGDDFVSVGVAPHSIRAVEADALAELAGFARDQDIPLHIHACEQTREIEESIHEYGKTPIAVFEERGLFNANTTLVHATHLTPEEHTILATHKPFICACPTTERNLGDGFLPASKLWENSVPVCLGSDSHANIDLWEEMRLLEYHERLIHQQRNVLATIEARRGHDDRRDTWRAIFPSATLHGANSLGVEAGVIAEGRLADFVTLDLSHRTLAPTQMSTDVLLNNVALSMPPDAVSMVYVGGRKIYARG